MAARCYLGVDLGAESGRVVAGLFDGRKVELKVLHRFSNGPVNLGGTMRWDVLKLWTGIQEGLNKANHEFGSDIASIGNPAKIRDRACGVINVTGQPNSESRPPLYFDGREVGRVVSHINARGRDAYRVRGRCADPHFHPKPVPFGEPGPVRWQIGNLARVVP